MCSPPTINIPEEHPTENEMANFNNYILSLGKYANDYGAVKIIPPNSWSPCEAYDSKLDIISFRPTLINVVHISDGVFYQTHQRFKTSLTYSDYQRSFKATEPLNQNLDDREREFWNSITQSKTIYGPDVPNTLFNQNQKIFNFNFLNDPVSIERETKDNIIIGLNTPYLYFGSWRTSFAFHVEDFNLYSISYLHAGAPKTWYIIPPRYGKKFENLSKEYLSFGCPDAIKHKMFMPSPKTLIENKIEFGRIRQSVGEFVVTFPFAYHGGFNNGLNIAEEINFGIEFWYRGEYQRSKKRCSCGEFNLTFKFDEKELKQIINEKKLQF